MTQKKKKKEPSQSNSNTHNNLNPEQYLLQDLLGIILQPGSNICSGTNTAPYKAWQPCKLASVIFLLSLTYIFFIASTFRSLLDCLELNSQARPKHICGITELDAKGPQCKYSKVASYI